MANLPQLVPIDLAFLATARFFDFGFGFDFLVRDGLLRVVGHRRGQLEQMALPFAFGETLSSAAKRLAFVPSQVLKCGGVLLLQLLIRGRRFVQHTCQFHRLLFGLGDTLLKVNGLLVGNQQKLVALGQIVG